MEMCIRDSHIAAGAAVGIGVQGVLAVMHQREVHAGLLLDGGGDGVQAAVAGGVALDGLALDPQGHVGGDLFAAALLDRCV